MPAHDPTSVAHSLPTAPNRHWTVAEVARLQQEAAAAHTDATDGATVGRPGTAVASPAPSQTISGRYRASGAEVELELRVDVDGVYPTRRLSGDFFRRSGMTVTYTGSFIVNTPQLTLVNGLVTIEGEGVFSFPSASPRLRVTVPIPGPLGPPAAATAQFLTAGGMPAATYVCAYESPFFRTLEFELDAVEDITPFEQYDTALLPSGGPGRILSVPAAYAEAGIEIVQGDPGGAVPIALAGNDRIWADRELHTAMQDHFSQWVPHPGWRVWLLAATRHEKPNLRGLMFDTDRRQGCAVFHDIIGNGPEHRIVRGMLRTYMHELGHCFNLYHSHQKDLMQPPRPNRMDALSWMHYPANFRSGSTFGEAAYWRAFPFQFDDDEIVHLRHAFRNAIIPGGQPFGLGAADVAASMFADRVSDESGLRLELRAPPRFLLGTPVVIEIKLSLTDLRGRTVNAALHPKNGYVQIGISRMDGRTVVYRPLITECAEPQLVPLDESRPAVYESAYIGYGKDGFYFGSPGQYELRAVYQGPDGSSVASNRLRIQIKSPASADEDELADLFFGDDQGTLLYLLGSDDERLKRGRDALQLACDKYPAHPLTSYARLVEGMNMSRPFKRIPDRGTAERSVVARRADPAKANNLLSKVVGSATEVRTPTGAATATLVPEAVPRLDNISLNMVMCRLAEVRRDADDVSAAEQTLRQMLDFFVGTQKVPSSVHETILESIRTILGPERAEALSRTPRP
jgi:hypothetical protein